VIGRFFRPESTFRRLQLVYKHKLSKEGKYKHLNLYGFFLQLSPRAKVLNMLRFKPVKSAKLVVAKVDEFDYLQQLKKLRSKGVLLQNFEDNPLSLEEMCINLDLFGKLV